MSAKAKRAAKKAQTSFRPPLGKAVTLSDVLMVLHDEWPMGLTRREIAEKLGRQVTPSIISKIETLVDANEVIREHTDWPNGVWGYRYYFKVDPPFADSDI